jgi:hypothetical protein
MKIIIYNNRNCHYELIESLIHKYHLLYNLDPKVNNYNNDDIFLINHKNESFENYIKNKYPKINFLKLGDPVYNCDLGISVSTYNADFPKINLNDKKNVFITQESCGLMLKYSNIFHLTPLCGNANYLYCDILPFQDQKTKNDLPIYIIQGNITSSRRNYKLLEILLNTKFDHDFKIRMVGRGKELFQNKKFLNQEKLEWKLNLNFEDYHKQFLDGYCILPLISKKTHPQYYTKKLTSTINYIKGYDLKCIIDSDLQNIYSLDKAYVYDSNNIDDFINNFNKTLESFNK